MSSFAAVDFETATSRHDSACAIGVVVVDDWTPTWKTHELIRPPHNAYDRFNVGLHGIGPSTTRDARGFCDVWADVAGRIGDRPLIAHNAPFDMSVLRKSCSFHGTRPGDFDFACTLRMARLTWPRLDSYGLSALARRFGIALDHHNALSDAKAAARLAQHICDAHGTPTVAAAARRLGLRMGRVRRRGYRSFSRGRRW